jgi:hypothetical protein
MGVTPMSKGLYKDNPVPRTKLRYDTKKFNGNGDFLVYRLAFTYDDHCFIAGVINGFYTGRV